MSFRYNHLIDPKYFTTRRGKLSEKHDPIFLPARLRPAQLSAVNEMLRGLNRTDVELLLQNLYQTQGPIISHRNRYSMENTGKKGIRRIPNPDKIARSDYMKLVMEHESSANTQPLPGLFSICMGYDTFGPYADQAAIKRRLFDPKKIKEWNILTLSNGQKYSYYPFVSVNTANTSDYRAFAEKTAKHLSEKLVGEAGIGGGYYGFHGEFDLSYNEHKTVDAYHQFGFVNSSIQKYYIHFNETDDFKKYLHDDVLEAFEKMDPIEFYEDYGAYFTTGIVVGGRLRQTSVTDMFRMSSEMNLDISLKASFLSIVESELSREMQEYNEEFRRNSAVRVTTKGGNVGIVNESQITQEQYLAWKSSVEDSPVFCDFTNRSTQRALTPIWQIVPESKQESWRKAERAFMKNFSRDFPCSTDPNARRAVRYTISTVTSNRRPCTGTDSKITIKLTGKDPLGNIKHSDWLQHDDSRNNHESGATDDIEMPIIKDVGFPFKITIHHDGANDAPWWELKDLKVVGDNNFEELVAECNNAGFNNETKEFPLMPKS